jgi:cysteine desulfurase family protein (TIGR01976 family)
MIPIRRIVARRRRVPSRDMTSPISRRGIDVEAVRAHFPALGRSHAGRPLVYMDGPAGTQLPTECIEAIVRYIETSNANHGGAFVTSVETDALLSEAHAAAADFLGAHEPEEIAFGANMTTITLAVSRALGRDLGAGDEIVLSRLDHDANVAPWLAMAEERSVRVRWLEVRADDCTLDLDGLESLIGERTRLVALGLASNAVGTLNDVGRVIEMAHAYGARVFVDAVHAAPHVPIDVSSLRADYLVCSSYKFYAPHLGILYGRRDLLEQLRFFRVRPAGEALPGKLETGTPPFELLAGLLGTFDYLTALGRAYGDHPGGDRWSELHAAMAAIRAHEHAMTGPLLEGLASVPGLRVHGIIEPSRFDERVPTVAFRIAGLQPRRIAEHLAGVGINVWDGDMYAIELIRSLGLDDAGGIVRVGLMHYNTLEEVDRLAEALRDLTRAAA